VDGVGLESVGHFLSLSPVRYIVIFYVERHTKTRSVRVYRRIPAGSEMHVFCSAIVRDQWLSADAVVPTAGSGGKAGQSLPGHDHGVHDGAGRQGVALPGGSGYEVFPFIDVHRPPFVDFVDYFSLLYRLSPVKGGLKIFYHGA
jgi:hypothetical protein